MKANTVIKRTMTPGKIAAVINKLEKLRTSARGLPNSEVQERLERIVREIKRIERDLDNDEAELFRKQISFDGLPPLDNRPFKRGPHRIFKEYFTCRSTSPGASLDRGAGIECKRKTKVTIPQQIPRNEAYPGKSYHT